MDNKEKKLTPNVGKRYDGNMMEDNGEKRPVNKDSSKEQGKGDKISDAKSMENKDAGVRPAEKSREAFDWNKLTEEEKKKLIKERKELESRSDKEKEPGLFDILMEILKAIFGIDDKEAAEKIIDNSEAMRGLQAYWRIKPQNNWDVNDYGRVFFMLASDTSTESLGIQAKLETDARNAGISTSEISDKTEKIAEEQRKVYPKQSGHEEMTNRAIAMTALLWREQKEAVAHLGANELEDLGEYVDSLKSGSKHIEDMNDLIFLQRALAWVKNNNVRNTTSGGSGPREEKEDTSEGGESVDKERSDRRYQDNRKEGKKNRGKFSKEIDELLKERVESGDPKFIKFVFELAKKRAKKYGRDPKEIEKGVEEFLKAVKNSKDRGSERSEKAEEIAKLLGSILSKDDFDWLRMSGGGGEEKKGKEEKEKSQDNKKGGSSDQGENRGRKDTIGGRGYVSAADVEEAGEEKNQNQAQDDKEDGSKNKREKPVSIMNEKELREYYGVRFEQMAKDISVLPEMLETSKKMLDELVQIKNNTAKMVDSYMLTISDDPNFAERNPAKYKQMVDEYFVQSRRQMMAEASLERFTRGEKRVLGEEKDYHLYAGTIAEAMDERMRRIEYFMTRRRDGEIDLAMLGGESVLNNNASNIDKGEKVKREEFLKRANNRYKKFKDEGTLVKQEGLYFQEIQRRVGNILENSVYGYGDKKGNLRMPEDVYEKFKEIREMDAYIYKYKDESEYREKILGKIKYLREKKFLDYFRGVSYLNLEGKDIDPNTAYLGSTSMGYPSSIEATMLLVAEDRGAEYRTGAEHELIDASGKFHQENFIYWMRKEMNKLTDWDPWSQIDPMRGITFKAGFSSISLFDILFLPQYTQHQEVEMAGDVTGWYDESKAASFSVDWGQKKDHPDMDYDTRVNRILIDEPWLYGVEHNDYVALYNVAARSDPKKYIEVKTGIAQSNNYARVGLWGRRLMLPSRSGHGGKDTENYLKKKKQGKMGEAVDAGQLFYRYYTDFTEKHLDINEEGKATGVREKNMAYEALDIDGASIFLTSIGENALEMADPVAAKEIKRTYANFILERIGDIEKEYKGKGDEGDKKILIEKCREEVRKLGGEDQDKLKISFDNFDMLTDLQMKIERVALGKTEVSAKEKRDFKLDDKQIMVKEEVEKKVKKKMRENIGEFLMKVMEIEIPEVEEDEKGVKGKFAFDEKGGIKHKKIGDFEVFMDGNNRVVTEKEGKEMGSKNKKTFRKIMEEDLGADKRGFAKDSAKLDEYGDAVRRYEEAAEQGRSVEEIAKDIERLKNECGDIFRRRERLGLAMLTKAANIERKKLNFWVGTRPPDDSGRVLVKKALMKAIGATYDLDDHEQLYAHDRIWYPLEYMEVGAFNNTSRVIGGVQMGTNYNRLPDARKNYFGLSTMGGSLETLDEVNLREPTYFERLKMKKRGEGMPNGIPQHSLIEIMKGGEGETMLPRHLRRFDGNPDKIYESQHNWEHADVIDGLPHLEELRKLIVEEHPELGSFHEIVTINAWGVRKVDHGKARKLVDAYWNHARLGFGSHQIDYNKMIWVDGREISVRDYFFGPHTRKTQDIMENYYKEMAVKAKNAEDRTAYADMAKEIKRNPAMAFVMNMVTSDIHEHMTFDSSYEMWSTQIVEEIAWLMEEKFQQINDEKTGKKGEHKEGHKPSMKPSMMPYELFNRLLGVQEGDSMDKYMFWDLFYCLVGGFIEGWGEMQKEVEDELTGQPKKQWIG